MTPSEYALATGKPCNHQKPKIENDWKERTVASILERLEYTGCTANFRSTTRSFKDHRKINIPKEQWKIFENTHEPIIDENTFNIVQKIRENRDTSYTQTEEYRKNMSLIKTGSGNGMYGKHHTEESKKKMSEHSKGKTSGEKNGMYGKSGNNALNGKKIAMYDEDMNLIQIFNAKTAVLAFLNMKGHTGLDKAIKEGSLYKGYFWKNY